jgi:hypothetical protein
MSLNTEKTRKKKEKQKKEWNIEQNRKSKRYTEPDFECNTSSVPNEVQGIMNELEERAWEERSNP